MARSQPLEIELFGGAEASAAFRAFTGPHKRFPFLPSKTFGAALLPIPEDQGQALRGPALRNLRQRRNRALERGYRFAEIDAPSRVEQILAINHSADRRQGMPLTAGYTNPALVRKYCASRRSFYGVLDDNDVLRAYCHVPVLGDVFNFARILGQQDRLRDGIMYLMVSEAIEIMREHRERLGYPHWAMYDMYIGGAQGLRIFKKECGFRPHRVNWRWSETRAHSAG